VPSVAFVFPGQGSQLVGMGRALAETSPAAGPVFAAADAALGEPISRLAWEGPEETLNLTENAQPALLAASIAYLEACRERWAAAGIEPPSPAFAAGHSMGQYSALVAAGAVDLADGVRLVRERGRQMQARVPDARAGWRPSSASTTTACPSCLSGRALTASSVSRTATHRARS
jgi:[acyl-carrier-protein] S-malonyltransferase